MHPVRTCRVHAGGQGIPYFMQGQPGGYMQPGYYAAGAANPQYMPQPNTQASTSLEYITYTTNDNIVRLRIFKMARVL